VEMDEGMEASWKALQAMEGERGDRIS